MKTWKIIAVAGFALIAAALLTASAFAYMGGRGIYSPYETNTGINAYGTYPGGMMSGIGNGGIGSSTIGGGATGFISKDYSQVLNESTGEQNTRLLAARQVS